LYETAPVRREESMKRLRRGARHRFGFLVCGVAFASIGAAMDRYVFKPLPHLGFGGEALGLQKVEGGRAFIGSGAGIFGYVLSDDSRQLPAAWRSNEQGGFNLTLLPTPVPGAIGEARDAVKVPGRIEYPNLTFIVGSAQDQAGVWKPIVWRGADVDQGVFVAEQLPTVGGPSGSVQGAGVYQADQWWGICHGYSQNSAGQTRPTIWVESALGFSAMELPTLGGENGEILAVNKPRYDHIGNFNFAGRSQTASGEWHACLWKSIDGGVTWIAEDRNPFGAISSVLSSVDGWETASPDVNFIAGGDATYPDGRTVGFTVDSDLVYHEYGHGLSYRNSSVSGVLATRYGARLVGSAWNNPANHLALIWNSLEDLGLTRNYDATMVTPNPADADLRRTVFYAMDERAIVGSFRLTREKEFPTDWVLPYIMEADGTQLPDVVEVTVGTTSPIVDETALWHVGDGRSLDMVGDPSKGGVCAVRGRYYFSADIDRIVSHYTGQVVGSPDASAEGVMQALNFVTGQWDIVGVMNLTTSPHSSGSVELDGRYVHPFTGEFRTQFTCIPQAGHVSRFRIDRATLEPAS
jgi:hypothetical protein